MCDPYRLTVRRDVSLIGQLNIFEIKSFSISISFFWLHLFQKSIQSVFVKMFEININVHHKSLHFFFNLKNMKKNDFF